MSNAGTFDSTKLPLQDILKEIGNGRTQLPDFQRGWVWEDERIRSLIASVSVSFPIGAVMLLETGGEGVQFKPRPVEGTEEAARGTNPDVLILDGQQRLTSLYQALVSGEPVHTKDVRGKTSLRHYYINMEAALGEDSDPDDSVFSVPHDGIVKTFGGEIALDLSSQEREFELGYFPVNHVFAAAGWRRHYNDYWQHDRDKSEFVDHFEAKVVEPFKQYQLPILKLTKETPKEAVCLVFEKVNTGGVPLNVFELVTASFAAENFQLRDDWRDREHGLKSKYNVLKGLQSDDFLQAISLLVTQERQRQAAGDGVPPDKRPGISCKRRDILRLEVADYNRWADAVEKGLERAAKFLHRQKIFKSRDLPYRTQLVPLAALFVELGKEGESEGAFQAIEQWYWCGVLGELYGGAIESRFAFDLPEVAAMVRGPGTEPRTVRDANFQPVRLLSLRTRNSAAYKGVYALLMRYGCRDFRTGNSVEGQTFFDEKMDIHHVFPERWCKEHGLKPEVYNSIINKTAISARTNRQVGGKAPSEYLPRVEKDAKIDSDQLDGFLESHLVPAEKLRADDFWSFYEIRGQRLLDRIQQVTGKPVASAIGVFREETAEKEYQEEEGDEDEDTEDETDEAQELSA